MQISLIISIFVSFILLLVSGSYASFLFSLLILIIGSGAAMLFRKEHRVTGAMIFYIVNSFYSIFALIHYIDAIYYNNYIFRDEYGSFIPLANYLANSSSISELFNVTYNSTISNKNAGYNFYIGSIAYFAQNYLDGNSELLLFLSSVLFGSLLSVLLYRIISNYCNNKVSIKYTLLFMFLSPIVLFSFSLLRDIHIAFFYLCVIFIVLRPFSLKGLFWLIMSIIITLNLREQSGIFLYVFLLYYLYKKLKQNKIAISLLLILFFYIGYNFIIDFINDSINVFEHTSEVYTEKSLNNYASADAGSLGVKIKTLPSPFNEIISILYSQIAPFPPWAGFIDISNIYNLLINLFHILYSIFWYTIIFSLIKWFILRRKYLLVSFDLKILLLIALLLIILNLVNIGHRRIMYVYPIIYFVYVIINTKLLTRKQINTTLYQSSFSYLALIVLYLIVKFI